MDWRSSLLNPVNSRGAFFKMPGGIYPKGLLPIQALGPTATPGFKQQAAVIRQSQTGQTSSAPVLRAKRVAPRIGGETGSRGGPDQSPEKPDLTSESEIENTRTDPESPSNLTEPWPSEDISSCNGANEGMAS